MNFTYGDLVGQHGAPIRANSRSIEQTSSGRNPGRRAPIVIHDVKLLFKCGLTAELFSKTYETAGFCDGTHSTE